MPNWCSTAYAIEGNATELKKLYELMKDLEKRQKPSVQNGFGTTWLGCLVEALGESWEKIYCRGTWDNLKFNGEVLTFNTETAWSPCNEMFDMVCEKYPTLRYFYQSEEPGMCEYWTNDDKGKYFPDRYYVDVCTSEEEYYSEYFQDLESVYDWLEDICEVQVKSRQDVNAIVMQWKEKNEDTYCSIHEYQISA